MFRSVISVGFAGTWLAFNAAALPICVGIVVTEIAIEEIRGKITAAVIPVYIGIAFTEIAIEGVRGRIKAM